MDINIQCLNNAYSIIHSSCMAIWEARAVIYLKAATFASDGKANITYMFEEWNFPNCLGTVNGKHILIECPARCGSEFYRRKGFHSIVLLPLCGANCRVATTPVKSCHAICLLENVETS